MQMRMRMLTKANRKTKTRTERESPQDDLWCEEEQFLWRFDYVNFDLDIHFFTVNQLLDDSRFLL